MKYSGGENISDSITDWTDWGEDECEVSDDEMHEGRERSEAPNSSQFGQM